MSHPSLVDSRVRPTRAEAYHADEALTAAPAKNSVPSLKAHVPWADVRRWILSVKSLEVVTMGFAVAVAFVYATVWRNYARARYEQGGDGAQFISFNDKSSPVQEQARIDPAAFYLFFAAAYTASIAGWAVSALFVTVLLADRRLWRSHVSGFFVVIILYAAFWFGFWSDHYDKALVPVSSYLVFMYAYVPLAVGIELYRSLRAGGKSVRVSVQFAVGYPAVSSTLIFSLRTLVLSFSGLGDLQKVLIRVTLLPILGFVFQGLFRELSRMLAKETPDAEIFDAAAPLVTTQYYTAAMCRLMQSRIRNPYLQVLTEVILFVEEVVHVKCLLHNKTMLQFLFSVVSGVVCGSETAALHPEDHLGQTKEQVERRHVERTVLHGALIPVVFVQGSFASLIGSLVPLVFNINMDGPVTLPTQSIIIQLCLSYTSEAIISDMCATALCGRAAQRDPSCCVWTWSKSSQLYKVMMMVSGIGAGLLLPLFVVSLSACVTMDTYGNPLLYACTSSGGVR